MAAVIDWSRLVIETGGELFDPPEAVFDLAKRYRYRLTRTWGAGPVLVVVMLNPSTADAFRNDPTIVRVTDFAKRAGFGGIIVVNLFAWRATKPAALRGHPAGELVGEFGDAFILNECKPGRTVLAAWGTNGALNGRACTVLAMLTAAGVPLMSLAVTKDGHPSHPLYLPAGAQLAPYAPPATCPA